MNFYFFFSFFLIFYLFTFFNFIIFKMETSEQHTGTDLGNFVYSPTGFVRDSNKMYKGN